jgi:hypothetical protein
MTACRADRTMRALLIAPLMAAGLLAAGAAAPAFAQNPGSNLLRPPPPRVEPPPAATADPAGEVAPRATPQLQAPAGIEVEVARPLDPEAIGLIDAARGGFPPDAWAASGRAFAERLVRDLPAPLASQPLRELAWRTLASTAAGPLVATSLAAPGANAQANFAGLRAGRLRALGDIESAAELARRIPDRMTDPALARLLIDAAFLAQADERACALVREALARGRDVALQKALMFCQAIAGDGDRAQLGLAMLRDQGAPEDPAFVTLLLAIGGDGRGVRVDTLRNADPLSLAMLRAAKVAPPADSVQSSDPAVLAALARGDWGTPEFRLAAAERAEAFGAMPAGELADFYRAIELTAAQSADPAAFARGDGGPRGRAALFKAADAAPIGPARLTALQALWNHGRERGGYATLARASVVLLAQTPPSSDTRFAAADAARALLMAGEREAATGWIRLVRAAQIGGDTAATNEAARIWLLATLAGIETGEARSSTRLAAWRQALDASDARTAPARASLGVALLSGLGHLPGGGAALAFPQTALERQTASLPHPALVTALHEAGIGGRPAECALLVVHMLGGEGAAGAPVYVLLSVLDGLRAVGLEENARLLALESAIASGL